MAAKTQGQRLDRLEQIVQVLAEDHLSLREIVSDLAPETRRGFDRVAAQMADLTQRMWETDERMRQTDERMRQTDERMRQTDKRFNDTDDRIGKLVLAIGELIRHQKNGKR